MYVANRGDTQKMKLNVHSLRILLPLFLTSLLIFEAAAYVTLTPRPHQTFLQEYALGAGGLASDYYPNNSTFIQQEEFVKWYIGVSNQMGSLQFVDIQVKLGNQTIAAPNDTTLIPSPAPLIVEFKRFIQNNETWTFPFVWRILNFTTTATGRTRIVQMQINNVTYLLQNSPTCASLSSCGFRFIFELWTWNIDLAQFQIGWWNEGTQQIAWLQLWFDITPGAP